MSVLIKGMKMPLGCKHCCFSWMDVGEVWYCNAVRAWGLEITEEFNNDTIHKDCPLVEIPSDAVVPVKHGKWNPVIWNGHIDTDEWYGELYRCDLCGCEMIGTCDYCPDCGAKMDIPSDQ